jgi:hypothetical protein
LILPENPKYITDALVIGSNVERFTMPRRKSLMPRVARAAKSATAAKMTPLEKLYNAGELHPDPNTNRLMLIAGEIWYEFAMVQDSQAALRAIQYRALIDAGSSQAKFDQFMAEGMDRNKKARFYRQAIGAGSAQLLDTIIYHGHSTMEAADILLKRKTKPAQIEILARFRQALEIFAALCRLPGT